MFFSFAKKLTWASTVHCEVPTDSTLSFSTKSLNRTASSSSRGMFLSCRSNLIMNFLKLHTHFDLMLLDWCLSFSFHEEERSWMTNSQQVLVLAWPLQQISLCLWTVERSRWKFLTFLWSIYWSNSQYEPMNCLVFKQEFNHYTKTITSFVR